MATSNQIKSEFTLYEYLTKESERWATQRNELIQKFTGDVTYHFAWIGEELFKASYKCDWYKGWMNNLNNHDGITIDVIMKEIENFLSRSHNVRENSSGSLHREVSTWKFICTMEIREQFQKDSRHIIEN
jgi:hypothetical protein